MSTHARFTTALLILSLAAAGCGRHAAPTSAAPPGAGAAFTSPSAFEPGGFLGSRRALFFPLAIGNRWHYAVRYATSFVPADTSAGWSEEFHDSIDARLARHVMIGGRDYVEEEQAYYHGYSIYMRQDFTGLYEADTVSYITASAGPVHVLERLESGLPAAARPSFRAVRAELERKLAPTATLATGGFATPIARSLKAELTRLRYPLNANTGWVVRADPSFHFSARVEAFESLDLPAGRFEGWRIRYLADYYGPQDVVRVWYGPDGLLSLVAHVEVPWTDAQGRFRGTWVYEQSQRLDEIALVGSRP